MGVIYRPWGRAEEYSLLACNLYGGVCPHRCSYCYVPSAMRKSRAQWEEKPWYVRKDILEWLRRDAERLRGTDERVLLCFHCDPYSPEAAESGVTRKALEILREFGVPFQVLTKGGTRACGDFDLYGRHDAFATTMTFLDANLSEMHEPGAALPADRIKAILEARRLGIETWVSLEPVLDPCESLRIIRETWELVDLYKVGKLNHDAELERKIDAEYGWGWFAREAMNLCNRYSRPFVFKKDLLAYCDFEIVGAATWDTRKVVRL